MSLEDLPEPIKENIYNRVNKKKEFRDNQYYITELTGCLRKAYFNRTETEKPEIKLDDCWHIFRGLLFDDYFSEILNKENYRTQTRVTHRIRNYPKPIIITGRFDFENKETNAIADWKTNKDLFFIKRDGIKTEHLEQLMFYCYCEGKNKLELYYIDMGEIIKLEKEVNDDELEQLIETLEQRAILLDGCLTNKCMPEIDRIHNKDYWECRYTNKKKILYKCPYFSLCYGDE